MSTTVLGFNISMPIMVAPTAMQKMAHPDGMSFLEFISCQERDVCFVLKNKFYVKMKCLIVLAGELATARATSAAGTIMVLILSPPLSHTLLDIFLKGSLVLFLTGGSIVLIIFSDIIFMGYV